MAGTLVCVVGPSGAGKDSVMNAARALLGGDERVAFPRRFVTRPADAGGEEHMAVAPERFVQLRDDGALALWWEAHGIAYGIGAEVGEHLAAGRLVVVNVSRAVVARARAAFERVVVVEITADPEVLARRLAGRGRESSAEIAGRLARSQSLPIDADETIVNDGVLDEAAHAFVAILKRCSGLPVD